MPDYARIENGNWKQLSPNRQIITGEGQTAILHPGDILVLWPEEDLEVYGILPILDPDPIPEGQQEVSRTLVDQDGHPKWQLTLEDIPSQPHRVTRIDFVRLFTFQEQAMLNAARKQVAALPPEAYTDPTKQLLVSLEVVLQQFDLPEAYIELDHADTVQGVGLLAMLGLLSNERMAQVLAGQAPA